MRPNSPRLSVAVVQGGPSVEAEVSRTSAKAVAHALAEAGHRAVRVELDPFLPETIRSGGYEVVFPAVHGAVGEDGALQGLLEVLEIPYVGSDVLACALAMDKRHARRVFAEAGLPIARGVAIAKDEHTAYSAAVRARSSVGRRLVVKPGGGGSAIGVSRLTEDATENEVATAIDAAWAVSDIAIIEHFARGAEVTCGILDLFPDVRTPSPPSSTTAIGVARPTAGRAWFPSKANAAAPVDDVDPAERAPARVCALPPTLIESPFDAFYTYEARYAPGRSVHTCAAPLGDATVARVQAIAFAAHRALGCRDLSRVDFIVGDDGDEDAITLLEVNTLPGFTPTSLYPEAAAVAGLSFSALCDRLVQSARARGSARRNTPRAFPR